MAPRTTAPLLCALAAALLLASSSGAAAARPAPSPSPIASSSAPTPSSCSSQCGAAVAACREARKAQQPDAAAIKTIASAYGCNNGGSAHAHCGDLSIALLDLFAYEKSGYNKDGVKPKNVVAWTSDDQGKKVPCTACAGTRDVCQSLSEICVPFCLNDRRPQSEWQIVGGKTNDLGGHISELPKLATSEILFNRNMLTTMDSSTNELGIAASYVAYTSRPAGSRASVHFHTSAVVSCVLEGCNRITLAEPSGGALEPASFCAKPDGTPTCYAMPAFVKLLNENVGPGTVRMLDVFSVKPTESYFHSLEPLGAKETRQGAGDAGGVEVTVEAGKGGN
jgi:hypothetical protein